MLLHMSLSVWTNGIRIIDTLDYGELQSHQTRSYYTSSFVSLFLFKSSQSICNTVHSQCPGTKLYYMFFIILDTFTEKDQSCILGHLGSFEDLWLELVRCEGSEALSTTRIGPLEMAT